MTRWRFVQSLVALFASLLTTSQAVAQTSGGFLTKRQRATIAAAAEALLGGREQMIIPPAEVAENVDNLLARIPAGAVADFRTLADVLEWWLPLTTLTLRPFSSMSLWGRRLVLRNCIKAKGIFAPLNDIARGAKTLTCVGYYGDSRVMAAIGYVPFEQRPRSALVDQTPAKYPDPFTASP